MWGTEWDLKGLSRWSQPLTDRLRMDCGPPFLDESTKASGGRQPVQGRTASKDQSWYIPAKSTPSPARNDKDSIKGSIEGEIPQGRVSATLVCDNPIPNLPLTWASRTLRRPQVSSCSRRKLRPACAAPPPPFYRWQSETLRGLVISPRATGQVGGWRWDVSGAKGSSRFFVFCFFKMRVRI